MSCVEFSRELIFQVDQRDRDPKGREGDRKRVRRAPHCQRTVKCPVRTSRLHADFIIGIAKQSPECRAQQGTLSKSLRDQAPAGHFRLVCLQTRLTAQSLGSYEHK